MPQPQSEPEAQVLFLTNILAKSRLSSWVETPLIENMPKNVVLMEIEKVTWELEDTKTLRLKWPENYDLVYKTGQFITLYWPDCPKYKRAYSLSSSALDRGFYEVTIKRDGKMVSIDILRQQIRSEEMV